MSLGLLILEFMIFIFFFLNMNYILFLLFYFKLFKLCNMDFVFFLILIDNNEYMIWSVSVYFFIFIL